MDFSGRAVMMRDGYGVVGHPPPQLSPSDDQFVDQPKTVVSSETEHAGLHSPSKSPWYQSQQDQRLKPAHLLWRPLYLRAWALLAFIVTFVLLLIAVEIMLFVSNRTDGLTTSAFHLHYFWTYGPTLGLTILAVAWSRVEFQSKIVASWLSLCRGRPADVSEAAARDYLSMLQPTVVYRSFANRDFAVAASTMVSMLLMSMVIVSTGLITLSPTQIASSNIPILVQSQFVNGSRPMNATRLFAIEMYNLMFGFMRADLSYPAGLTQYTAYQTVTTDFSWDAVLISEVDGLLPSLDCEPATINTTRFDYGQSWELGVSRMNYTLQTNDCKMPVSVLGPNNMFDASGRMFGNIATGACGGSSQKDDARIALIFGKGAQTQENRNSSSVMSIINSAQVICKPGYSIRRYTLVQNGTRLISLTQIPNSEAKLFDGLHPWDLAQTYMDSHYIPYDSDPESGGSTSYPILSQNVSAVLDPPWSMALTVYTDIPQPLSELFDPKNLSDFFQRYYRAYAAAIAHYGVPSSTPLQETALGLDTDNRLLVQPLAAHLIAALLGFAAVLALIACLSLRKIQRLPRNPCSLVGSAALLSLLRPLCSMTGDNKFRRSLTLNPVIRLGICIFVIAIILALAFSLRTSQSNDGLGPAISGPYGHYLWTFLPAFTLSLVRLYYASADFQSRALLPYLELSKGARYGRSLGIDLLNKYQFFAMYTAVRLRLYPIIASGAIAILTAALPILSASLFSDTAFSQVSTTQLHISSVFGYVKPTTTPAAVDQYMSTRLASLILQNNLSYPAFTYEDLIFPTFELGQNGYNLTGAAIEATVPAMQPGLICRFFDRSQLRVNLTRNYTIPTYEIPDPLRIDIPGENCRLVPDNEAQASNFLIGTAWKDTKSNTTAGINGIFGQGGGTNSITPGGRGCSSYIYVWGNFSRGRSSPLTSLSALTCNDTLDVVDVRVRFVGEDLSIDTTSPPVIIESSRRKTASKSVESFQGSLGYPLENLEAKLSNTPETLLLPFFLVLLTSPYGVPASAIADQDQGPAVSNAIKLQQAIFAAQFYSTQHRVPVDNSNYTTVDRAMVVAGGNSTIPFPATATADSELRRVIQDPASTFALIALLSVTLVLAITAFALMPKTAIISGTPTSTARLHALFQPGNILDTLPDKARSLSDRELEGVFPSDARFRLGWRATPNPFAYESENHGVASAIFFERPLELDPLLLEENR